MSKKRKHLPSAARESQPEREHLLGVANQQEVADQHRVVPDEPVGIQDKQVTNRRSP